MKVAAPWFEDLHPGLVFSAPGITLTEGLATLHQAAFGDRLRLPLDHHLCRRVTGRARPLAHPLLVCNLAVGQSTWASQRVLGNLFYQGLVLRRPVFLGDTLYTSTRVLARRQSRPRPDRPASGKVVLEMEVRNQLEETVMHFRRCPLLPCRDPQAQTGAAEPLEDLPALDEAQLLAALPDDWNLSLLPAEPPAFAELKIGDELRIEAADTVTLAPEIVRASLNMAMTHLDAEAGAHGRRLVYGGHTISLAAAQASRALPGLITHLAWEGCSHTGPVFEGDRLQTRLRLLARRPLETGGLLRLAVAVFATGAAEPRQVLDWDCWVLSA